MGSNPISPMLVFDTSPLQALHRGGVLQLLRDARVEIWIPGAVDSETRQSFARVGEKKVPDLDAHPWIRAEGVSDEELERCGARQIGVHRSTTKHVWLGRHLQRPELEAIVLARRRGAVLAIEDEEGLKCAGEAGVPVTGAAALLRDLARAGYCDLADAGRRAGEILSTGYYTRELEWLSRGIDDFGR